RQPFPHTRARIRPRLCPTRCATCSRFLIQYHKLDAAALVDAWPSWIDRAARTWLESGDLTKIVIEFYKPGATVASARWDFPIRYDGNGVDEMWIVRASFH